MVMGMAATLPVPIRAMASYACPCGEILAAKITGASAAGLRHSLKPALPSIETPFLAPKLRWGVANAPIYDIWHRATHIRGRMSPLPAVFHTGGLCAEHELNISAAVPHASGAHFGCQETRPMS